MWPRLGTFHLHLQKTNCIERQIQENNKSKHAACIHCLVSSLLMSSEGLMLSLIQAISISLEQVLVTGLELTCMDQSNATS